jgi:zinc protease
MKRRPMVSALAFIAVAAATSAAQRPARPTPVAPAQFEFPNTKIHTLPNGLRVIVAEDHAIPVVAVRAVVPVDTTYDPPGKEGLFAVTMAALREGTATKTVDQVAQASSVIGTAVSPTAFTTAPEAFAPALELMGDMLMHPSFDSAGFMRRRSAAASAVRGVQESPNTPGRQIFYSTLYGRDDPFTRTQYGSVASVNAITRDDVMQFYNRYIVPQGTTVIVSGDVSDADALAAVKRVFGEWTARTPAPRVEAALHPRTVPTTIYLFDRPDSNASIFVGKSALQRSSPDAFAMDLVGQVAQNRFTQTLREKLSFIYSGSQNVIWRAVPRSSDFVGSTVVRAAKADSALGAWLALLRGLHGAEPPTAAEVDAARGARVGTLASRIDGPDNVATRILESVRDNLPPDYLTHYAAGVNAASVADVSAASARYIDPEHLIIVVTGDRKVLEPALRAANLAPVVVVDVNGKPLP